MHCIGSLPARLSRLLHRLLMLFLLGSLLLPAAPSALAAPRQPAQSAPAARPAQAPEAQTAPATPARNPFNLIEAESFDEQNGVTRWQAGISYVDHGDWVKYSTTDFGASPTVKSVLIRLATPNSGGRVEVRLGSQTGALIATLPVSPTGSFGDYTTQVAPVTVPVTNTQQVYLVFKHVTPAYGFGIANVDAFRFSGEDASTPYTFIDDTHVVFPPQVPDSALDADGQIPEDYELPDISLPDSQGNVTVGSFPSSDLGPLYQLIGDPRNTQDARLRYPLVLRGTPPAVGARVAATATTGVAVRVVSVRTSGDFSLIQVEQVVPGMAQVPQAAIEQTLMQSVVSALAPTAFVPGTAGAMPAAATASLAPFATAQSGPSVTNILANALAECKKTLKGNLVPSVEFTGLGATLPPISLNTDIKDVKEPAGTKKWFRSQLRVSAGFEGGIEIEPSPGGMLECDLLEGPVLDSPWSYPVWGVPVTPFAQAGLAFEMQFESEIRNRMSLTWQCGLDLTYEPLMKIGPDGTVTASHKLSNNQANICSKWDFTISGTGQTGEIPWRVEPKMALLVGLKVGVGIGAAQLEKSLRFQHRAPKMLNPILRQQLEEFASKLRFNFITFEGGPEFAAAWENAPYVVNANQSNSNLLLNLVSAAVFENDQFDDLMQILGLKGIYEIQLTALSTNIATAYRPRTGKTIKVNGTAVSNGAEIQARIDRPLNLEVLTEPDPKVSNIDPKWDTPLKVAQLWVRSSGSGITSDKLQAQASGAINGDTFTASVTLTEAVCSQLNPDNNKELVVVGYNTMYSEAGFLTPSPIATLKVRCKQPPTDEVIFLANNIEIAVDAVGMQNPIRGKRCDPAEQTAKGIELQGAILPKPDGAWTVQSMQLLVDDQLLATSQRSGEPAARQVLVTVQDIDLAKGVHTLKLVATLRSTSSSETRTETYTTSFEALPKPCDTDRAKDDEATAIVYDPKRCPNDEDLSKGRQPAIVIEVVLNDDRENLANPDQPVVLNITSFTQGALGSVSYEQPAGGQVVTTTLLYRPSGAAGVDTFTYTVTELGTGQTHTGEVTVTVRKQTANDPNCPDDRGGGGDPNDDGGNGNTNRSRAGGWGDPHLNTADGVYFDSHAFGEFIYFRPKASRRGITVQGRQEIYRANAFPAVTTALAVKVSNRIVEFRSKKTPSVLLDGAPVTATFVDLGGGASLVRGDKTFILRTATTTTTVTLNNSWLDYTFDLPLNDVLEGMLGTPNGSAADDLRLPNGSGVGTPPDAFALANGWKVTERAQSLFTYDANEGPETYNVDNPLRNQVPDATTLAPYVTQATSLLTNSCDSTGATIDQRLVNDLALELFIGTSAAAVAAKLCTYEVNGTITSTNPAGAPIVGVRVNLSSTQLSACQTATDAQGRYSCRLAPVPNSTGVPVVAINVAGVPADSIAFAGRAPIHGSLAATKNLSITRPSIRLTVRSFSPNNQALGNVPVQISSGDVIQQLTTGTDGTLQTVLTYAPGTTSAMVQVRPSSPMYGHTQSAQVTLTSNGSVDQTLDVGAIRLDTPAWALYSKWSGSYVTFRPQVVNSWFLNTTGAVGSDGTIYTIGYQQGGAGSNRRVVATKPDGSVKWVTAPFAFWHSNGASWPTPVIGKNGTDDVIYVLGANATDTTRVLWAFKTDGTLKWVFEPAAAGYVLSQPAISADGTIYLLTAASSASSSTQLVALNPATGSMSWSYTVAGGSSLIPPLVGRDGTIYVAGTNLIAINPNGTLKQASTIVASNVTSMSIGANNALYLSTYNGTLALSTNLTQLWSKPFTTYSVLSGPDGNLYATSTQNTLLKLDPTTGAVIWTFDEAVTAMPVIGADGRIYVGVTVPVNQFVPYYNQLVTLDANKNVIARFNLASITSLIMGLNGTIYTMVDSNSDNTRYLEGLYAIPTGSSALASGWSIGFGNSQNTNRAQ